MQKNKDIANKSASPPIPFIASAKLMDITIAPDGQTVTIEPLKIEKGEITTELYTGVPSWRDGTRLPDIGELTFKLLKPETLKVTLENNAETELVEGPDKDYMVDKDWAAIGAVAGGKAEGVKVRLKYEFTKTRLDLIEQSADGKISVKKGKESIKRPLLPEATPGCTPLMSVYLPGNTNSLTTKNINIIEPCYTPTPFITGLKNLAKAKTKLFAGKPFTIAFIGDSITCQPDIDFADGNGNFVKRFAAHLQQAFTGIKVMITPKEKVIKPSNGEIIIVQAGIGGNTSSQGLARFETDVLTHQPDVVVIMFGVNDENGKIGENCVNVNTYKANLLEFVKKTRMSGGEPIIMTTSMKNTDWCFTAGNLNEYAEAARATAKEVQTCLVDNYRLWEEIPKTGYNYMIYLENCINHPNELGHSLFLAGIKRAFEPEQS